MENKYYLVCNAIEYALKDVLGVLENLKNRYQDDIDIIMYSNVFTVYAAISTDKDMELVDGKLPYISELDVCFTTSEGFEGHMFKFLHNTPSKRMGRIYVIGRDDLDPENMTEIKDIFEVAKNL